MFDRLQHLGEVDRSQQFPLVEPRDAASLLIVDRRGDDYKILMGQRHSGQKFAPGVFVFPGGAMELADLALARGEPQRVTRCFTHFLAGPLFNPDNYGELDQGQIGVALGLCALRETIEETGLMPVPGHAPGQAPAQHPLIQAAWREVIGGMHVLARAITPPGRRMRFDTRFLMIEIDEDMEAARQPDDEFTKLEWLTFDEACEVKLHAMTRVVLEDLNDYLAVCAEDVPLALQPQREVPLYNYGEKEFERLLLDLETPS